jgi:hypothetical protein
MAKFRRNPLFPKADKRLKALARQEWQATDAAKAVKQIRGAMSRRSGGGGTSGVLSRSVGQWARGGLSGLARAGLMGSEFGPLVHTIERYARSSGSAGGIVNELLEALGPVGGLIRNLMGSRGKPARGLEGDIEAALSFLESVAPENLSARGRKRAKGRKPATKSRTAEDVASQLEAAKELLESSGYQVTPPTKAPGKRLPQPTTGEPPTAEQTGAFPGGQATTTARGQPRKIVDLEINGKPRRFRVDHPIVTKEMIPSPESSNVHSFGYDYDKTKLYVRYQAGQKFGKGPGSLYAYSNVQPETFIKMMAAASKGVFVWDYIRIRGTVSGHQYDYNLVSIRNRYVPRKATYVGAGKEIFKQRTVRVKHLRTGRFETIKSGSTMDASPFRAAPNRG